MSTETFGTTTIIDDVGPSANSYVNVAYVKSRWDIDPNKDYSLIDDETIAKLAIYSTQVFDSEFWAMYAGYLFNSSYALFWPRAGAYDSRGVSITDYTVFPEDLKKSIAEQMWYLQSNDVFAVISIGDVKSQSLDGVGSKTFYDIGARRSALTKNVVSDLAAKMISPLLIGGTYGNSFSNPVVRG